ncbi:MAG: hypothetical protein KGL39_40295, partial [Patescibacteria group bacterium]|nr:hypothetical protein [Patescibacteria group bacterium]
MGEFFSYQDASRLEWGKQDYKGGNCPFQVTELAVGCLQRIADSLENIAESLKLLDPEFLAERTRNREDKKKIDAWLEWHRGIYWPFFEKLRQRLRAFLSPQEKRETRAVQNHVFDEIRRTIESHIKKRDGYSTDSGSKNWPPVEYLEKTLAEFDL